MQQQSDKNLNERKTEAKIALGGEEISNVNKNKEVRHQPLSDKIKKTSTPIPVKPKILKRAPNKTAPRPENPPLKKEKGREEKAFLEKIRPRSKRDSPLSVVEDKKIERVLSQKAVNNKNYNIPAIRTYKSDIADAVKKRGESLSRIAIKEKKREREAKKVIKKTPRTTNGGGRKILIIVGVLIAATSGLTITYQLYNEGLFSNIFKKSVKVTEVQTTTDTPTVPSLIPTNTERKIDISDKKEDVMKTIARELEGYSAGGVENIYLHKTIDVIVDEKPKQKQVPAKTKDLISLGENKVPNVLTRSLEEKFMLGIYSTQKDGNVPFLILTTNSYAQTFAGMIKWEQSLLNDFYKLFSIKTTVKTSNSFLDKVIAGTDTRILTDTKSKILILYSFINRETIIITTNKEAFLGILQKLNSK